MTIFFVGDTHFGHRNILEYEAEHRRYDTIEEHDQDIIDNWNSVVRIGDTVYHLGDVAFGRASVEKVDLLNGVKHLILGNHDNSTSKQLLKMYFATVQRKLMVKIEDRNVWMCHYPFPLQDHLCPPDNVSIYIHGHAHSRMPTINWRDNYPRVNVSLERINMTPISWENVLRRIKGFPEHA